MNAVRAVWRFITMLSPRRCVPAMVSTTCDSRGDRPASAFTPPPVSDDPPMSSDNIDQIMREMEERGQ